MISTFSSSKKKDELIKVSHSVEYQESISSIQEHVKLLKEENKTLKESNNHIRLELEDLKQYTRRTNLRMYGVPIEKGETSGKVLELVEKKVKEVTPENFKFGSPIDRAHRIGKKKTINGVVTQPIIFRFLTFRSRTMVYRVRK